MNNNGWTDWDLSKPREEWGSVEAKPVNNSPSYYNSEHYNLERSDRPVSYGESSVPGYKSSEHYELERSDRPVSYGESSMPGYKSSEHYYNDGLVFGVGHNINGKKVTDLILDGSLTPFNIKEEEKKIVLDDILSGETRNKDILAKKIDLLIADNNYINNIFSSQYNLALNELEKQKRSGYVKPDVVDRVFQFLATTNILMEKGYNVEELVSNKYPEKDFIDLLVNFKNQSSGASSIEDPSWFNSGVAPSDYDYRRINSASLYAGTLLINMFKNKKDLFDEKYNNYVKKTNYDAIPYEDYMQYIGIYPHIIQMVEEQNNNKTL